MPSWSVMCGISQIYISKVRVIFIFCFFTEVNFHAENHVCVLYIIPIHSKWLSEESVSKSLLSSKSHILSYKLLYGIPTSHNSLFVQIKSSDQHLQVIALPPEGFTILQSSIFKFRWQRLDMKMRTERKITYWNPR